MTQYTRAKPVEWTSSYYKALDYQNGNFESKHKYKDQGMNVAKILTGSTPVHPTSKAVWALRIFLTYSY